MNSPHFRVQQEVQFTVEVLRIAAVRDDAMTVVVRLVEAKGHAVQRAYPVGGPRIVHLLGGSCREERRGATFTGGQLRNHEAGHVRTGGGEAAGGCAGNDFVRLGRFRRHGIALRHQGLQRGG